ncbi:MAG: HEPN domain-containing protein [Dehalococcoidia bacterium]|nr:MAG: HEPN domain-containing protein [Dehalococcoidia bacterium]
MTDFLEELEKLAEQLKKGPTKEQQTDSQVLLKLARKDLKSSQLNYEGQIYNNAAYNLQQAVEKAAKSYFTLIGVLDAKTIRGTGHDSPKLFLRMLEQPWAKQFAGLCGASFPSINLMADTSEAQKVVDKGKGEMARMPSEHILTVLSFPPKLEKALEPIFETLNRDFITAYLRLYILACVTFPHEEFSRYGDKEVKPSEYTSDLGIVKAMPEVWTELETTIDAIQHLIESSGQRADNAIDTNQNEVSN